MSVSAGVEVHALPKGAFSYTVEVPRDVFPTGSTRPTELARSNRGPRVYGGGVGK